MNTKEVAEKLEALGIATNPYVRSQDGGAFIITIVNEKLRFHVGNASVKVNGDAALRQAVLTVSEPARSITRQVKASSAYGTMPDISTDEGKKQAKERARVYFPVTLPEGRRIRWTVKDLEVKVTDHAWYYDLSATVTAHISKGPEMSLLVGYDEGEYLFVSMLRKKVNTVEQAHAALRPPGVKADALRQGEWFFQPVSETMQRKLDQLIHDKPHVLDGDRWHSQLDDTTHFVPHLTLDRKTYAIGWVTDREHVQYGRFKPRHHMPILLQDWHKVIRNREVEAPNVTGNRSWD